MTFVSALRKTISIAAAVAIALPSPALAGSFARAQAGVVGGGTPVVLTVPTVGASLTPDSGASSLGIVPLGVAGMPHDQNAPVMQAQSVALHPVLDVISRLEASGLNVGTSGLSPMEAQKLLAAAHALPQGAAKQNIVSIAAMMAVPTGGSNSQLTPPDGGAGRVFDNASAAKSESAAPSGKWSLRAWFSGLGRSAKKAPEAQPAPQPVDVKKFEIPFEKLAYSPALDQLPESTRDIAVVADPAKPIVGQDLALKSLYYGLKMEGKGYNVSMSGPEGSGRETAAVGLAKALAKGMKTPNDLVQVTNFIDKKKPLLLELPSGQGPELQKAVAEFVSRYKSDIVAALNQKKPVAGRKKIKGIVESAIADSKAAFEAEVDAVRLPGDFFGIRLMISDKGDGTVTINWAITAPHDGKMQTFPDEKAVDAAIAAGRFTREAWDQAAKDAKAAAKPLIDKYAEMANLNNEIRSKANGAIENINKKVAESLVENLSDAIRAAVGKDRHNTPAQKQFEKEAQERMKAFTAEAAKTLLAGKFVLTYITDGKEIYPALGKLVDGEFVPLTEAELRAAMALGELNDEAFGALDEKLRPKFMAVLEKNREEYRKAHANDEPVTAQEEEARQYVELMLSHAASNYHLFMPSQGDEKRPEPKEIYQANVQATFAEKSGAPVVEVTDYSFDGIFGSADGNKKLMFLPNGAAVKMEGPAGASFTSGSLAQARDGFWIANTMDLLKSPGVWPALMRYARTHKIEIVEEGLLGVASLKGARYQVDSKTKLVLIMSPMLRMMLQQYDEDFALNFPDMSTAQFEPTLPIGAEAISGYLQFFRKVVDEAMAVAAANNSLPAIVAHTREAMAALLEFASKLSGSNEKLDARFGVAHALMREATMFARLNSREEVTRQDVDTALAARALSAGVYIRRHMDSYNKGTFKIETKGFVNGQINGLAVIGEDRGVPMRITVRKVPREPGDKLIAWLDRESGAEVTGPSFNKSAGVIETIIREYFGSEGTIPYQFRVSFEQNYGGIDGDSATSTVAYAIISELAEVGIDQSKANTGSADQRFWVQPIGGANAKTAGFFDVAAPRGLTGSEGVLIPATNVSELNLRADIRAAADPSQPGGAKFHLYAISSIEDGMSVLTGVPWETIRQKGLANIRRAQRETLKREQAMKAALSKN